MCVCKNVIFLKRYTFDYRVCGCVEGWGGLKLQLLCLEQNDPLLDRLAANGASVNLVAAHLAGSVAAQEHHVPDAIETDRAHCLFLDVLQLLLQFLDVVHQVQIARSGSTGDGPNVIRGGQRSRRSVDAAHVRGHGVVHGNAVSTLVDALK